MNDTRGNTVKSDPNICTNGTCSTTGIDTTGTTTPGVSVQVFEPTGVDIIYFFRDDCPNCEAVKPMIDMFNASLNRNVIFRRQNTSNRSVLENTRALGLSQIPAIAIAIDGQLRDIIIGVEPIRSAIDSQSIYQVIGQDPPSASVDQNTMPTTKNSSMLPIAAFGIAAYLLFFRK